MLIYSIFPIDYVVDKLIALKTQTNDESTVFHNVYMFVAGICFVVSIWFVHS